MEVCETNATAFRSTLQEPRILVSLAPFGGRGCRRRHAALSIADARKLMQQLQKAIADSALLARHPLSP